MPSGSPRCQRQAHEAKPNERRDVLVHFTQSRHAATGESATPGSCFSAWRNTPSAPPSKAPPTWPGRSRGSIAVGRGCTTRPGTRSNPLTCDDESVRSHFTPILLPRDVDVETALRRVQAEFREYDIRVLSWQHPKRDYTQPE